MDKDEVIKQLRNSLDQSNYENELLKKRVRELEALLAKYDNPHTPPSLKRGGNRKKSQNKNDAAKGKPGQKKGHKGVTRPPANPDKHVDLTTDRCPDCGSVLGDPFRVESKIIEEIPDPQPVIVTEYKIAHYTCPCCQKEVVATDSGCPKEGMFGNNAIAQTTLLKYEVRLPHRKIQNALNRQCGLEICPATILDLTRRAADSVQSEYEAILDRIRNASILYVDETSIKVQGKKYWIWAFTTPTETFIAVRKSRGAKVLREILTRRFKGLIVCDGWSSYPCFTKCI